MSHVFHTVLCYNSCEAAGEILACPGSPLRFLGESWGAVPRECIQLFKPSGEPVDRLGKFEIDHFQE